MIRRKVVIALIYLRSNATRQVGKQRERNESERASRGRERERGEAGSSATIDLLIIRQLLTVFPRELRKYIASFREDRTTRSLLRMCDTSMLLQEILETH